MKGLKGRTALVTGAGRGIGRAIALRLAAEGVKVGVNDVDAATAQGVAREASQSGGTALALPGDIANPQDITRMVNACVTELSGLAILVNNAGVDFSGAVGATSDADWRRLHDVDLLGPFRLIRAAESALAKHGGSVINISSNHAIATMADRSAYAAAKAGVVGLTRSLAIELGPRNIRVNAVLPGYIRTPIWSLWLDKERDPEATLAAIAAQHPVRRLGTPDDVAGTVAFLASDDASFITGATIVVDGGNTAQLEPPRS